LVYLSTSLLKKHYFKLTLASSRPLVLLIALLQFSMMKIFKTSGL